MAQPSVAEQPLLDEKHKYSLGGLPEPMFAQNKAEHRIWQRDHKFAERGLQILEDLYVYLHGDHLVSPAGKHAGRLNTLVSIQSKYIPLPAQISTGDSTL